MFIPLWLIVLVVVFALSRVRQDEVAQLFWPLVTVAILGGVALVFVYGLEAAPLIRQKVSALFDAYPTIHTSLMALFIGWMVLGFAWLIYGVVRARRE